MALLLPFSTYLFFATPNLAGRSRAVHAPPELSC